MKLTEYLTSIADAIREGLLSDGTEKYNAADFPELIKDVRYKGFDNGFDDGYLVGESEGYYTGYEEGHEEGYGYGYGDGYGEGYGNGQDSMIDPDKVIEKTKIGNPVVITDASELPHAVAVTISKKNLFDKNAIDFYRAYINPNDNGRWTYATDSSSSVRIKCSANTSYTISISSPAQILRVASIESESVPSKDASTNKITNIEVGNYINCQNSQEAMLITSENARYMVIQISSAQYASVINSLQVIPNKPISDVGVKMYGKNLFDGEFELGIWSGTNGVAYDNDTRIRGKNFIEVKDDTTYSFVFEGYNPAILIYEYDKDYNYIPTNGTNLVIHYGTPYTPTKGTKYIHFSPNATVPAEAIDVVKCQMEVGTKQTPIEDFVVPQEYTSDTDGIVGGFVSLSPYMTFITDADFDIEVNYWKSYGIQLEQTKFWSSYQQPKTNDGVYNYAFSYWPEPAFYPQYDIVPRTISSMFFNFNRNNEPIDLIARLQECGVVLDTRNMTGVASYTFQNARVTTIPAIDLSNGTKMECTFEGSTVEVIEKLILQTRLSEQEFRRTFHNCSNLREIRIENQFGQTVSFEHSPHLSVESLRSILTALTKDTAYASGKTLTLNSASQATVETDSGCSTQLVSAVNAGWTINYI